MIQSVGSVMGVKIHHAALAKAEAWPKMDNKAILDTVRTATYGQNLKFVVRARLGATSMGVQATRARRPLPLTSVSLKQILPR
jgi:hypothetical protein